MRAIASPRLTVVVTMTLLACLSGWASAGVWTSIGPDGGAVSALAIDPADPARLYAGGVDQVTRSADGAVSWSRSGSLGAQFTAINGLAVDPSNSSRLYAASFGVVTSADGGATWTAINNGLPPTVCQSITVDPATPATLFAGCNGQIHRSTDGGANWTQVYTGSFGLTVAIVVDPTDSSVVYAASSQDGALTSTDGGSSWTPINTGFPIAQLTALGVNPAMPTTLYAGAPPAFFTSVDGGANWLPTDVGLPSTPDSIVVDPATPSTLYVAASGDVFVSLDAAATWNPTASQPPFEVRLVAVDPAHAGTLYAAGSGGVAKSTDAGSTWSLANAGLRHLGIRRVLVHPTDPSTLYMTYDLSDGGLLRKSTDGGTTWTTLVEYGYSTGVALEPGNPNTIYYSAPPGLVKSMDGGATWTDLVNFPEPEAVSIAVDPVTTNKIFTGLDHGGIIGSADGGATWYGCGLSGRRVGDIVIDPGNHDLIYGAVLNSDGAPILRSTDGGGSCWGEFFHLAGALSFFDQEFIHTLDLDAAHPGTLYAGLRIRGVYKSTNGIASFAPMNTGLPPFAGSKTVNAFEIDPFDAEVVYVGMRIGVFRSTDGAANWSSMATGLPPFAQPIALAADPSTPGRIYAGTADHGLFVYAPLCGDGIVDTAEECDDGNVADGDCCSSACELTNNPCDDGDECTENDACANGDCIGTSVPCAACEVCTTGLGCHVPSAPGCAAAVATKSVLKLKKGTEPAKNAMSWGWKGVAPVLSTDFGQPTSSTALTVCVLDANLGVLLSATAPAGGTCGTAPCWSTKSSGIHKYKDKLATPQGLTGMVLKPSTLPNKAKISLKGKGVALDFPALPVVQTPVTVRLTRSDGLACWEATFSTPTKNDTVQFNAKSD